MYIYIYIHIYSYIGTRTTPLRFIVFFYMTYISLYDMLLQIRCWRFRIYLIWLVCIYIYKLSSVSKHGAVSKHMGANHWTIEPFNQWFPPCGNAVNHFFSYGGNHWLNGSMVQWFINGSVVHWFIGLRLQWYQGMFRNRPCFSKHIFKSVSLTV